MKTIAICAALLVVAFMVQPVVAADTPPREISEEAIGKISARLYGGLLSRACVNGKRYPRNQIEKGFRRHAGELKLQLAAQGYRIVPARTSSPHTGVAFPADPALPKFGCFRTYWLEE